MSWGGAGPVPIFELPSAASFADETRTGAGVFPAIRCVPAIRRWGRAEPPAGGRGARPGKKWWSSPHLLRAVTPATKTHWGQAIFFPAGFLPHTDRRGPAPPRCASAACIYAIVRTRVVGGLGSETVDGRRRIMVRVRSFLRMYRATRTGYESRPAKACHDATWYETWWIFARCITFWRALYYSLARCYFIRGFCAVFYRVFPLDFFGRGHHHFFYKSRMGLKLARRRFVKVMSPAVTGKCVISLDRGIVQIGGHSFAG